MDKKKENKRRGREMQPEMFVWGGGLERGLYSTICSLVGLFVKRKWSSIIKWLLNIIIMVTVGNIMIVIRNDNYSYDTDAVYGNNGMIFVVIEKNVLIML